jgi:hypothetical protein
MGAPLGSPAAWLALAVAATACSDNGTGPSVVSAVTMHRPTPAAAPGVISLITATRDSSRRIHHPGDGQVSIPIALTADREVPWARLNVSLLTADGYCGQNTPDAPTWGPFPRDSRFRS